MANRVHSMVHFTACDEPFDNIHRFQLRPFDLTPCFEEGIILSSLLVVLIIATVVKVWLLSALKKRERTRRSLWILRGKLVSVTRRSIKDETNQRHVSRHCSFSHFAAAVR